MSVMSVTERRFREGSGEKHLTTDPTRTRCQAVSKTKVKMMRLRANDPSLSAEECWPEAQCTKAAEPGAFVCGLHGGKSLTIKHKDMAAFMPIDLAEKLAVFEDNRPALVNRTNEIKQLLARNAALYESLEDLVLGEEGYDTVAEAKRALNRGDLVVANDLLQIALDDVRSEKEVYAEIRENIKLIDKLTLTHFNIEKELKLMTPLDQMKNLLEGLYRGVVNIFNEFIPDPHRRGEAMRQLAQLIRNVANVRQGVLSDVHSD